MPDDLIDDLAEARRKLDAGRQALERHPELDSMRGRLERMAEELERIEELVAEETADLLVRAGEPNQPYPTSSPHCTRLAMTSMTSIIAEESGRPRLPLPFDGVRA